MSVASNMAGMIPAMVDQVITQGATRAKASRAAKRQQATVAKTTTKKSWYVSAEATRRLGVHATMENRSESDIVNELLEGLNRFTMPAANNRASRVATASADTSEDRHDGQAA
jgi:hypothetical protein